MKLFRGMRALSLASGNTSGYLKYALGEVVFVVVGILLAFQIDNWNTHRNSVLNAHHLYEQVQSELVLNINNCNTVLAQYRGKDTLVHDILHREVTRQDYIDHLEYSLVLLTQEEVEVSSEAFLNLVNSQDVFAKDQGDIVLEHKIDQRRIVIDTKFNPLLKEGQYDKMTLKSKDYGLKDYTPYLKVNGIDGKRIGLFKAPLGKNTKVDSLLYHSIQLIKDAGGIIIEIDEITPAETAKNSFEVMLYEYKYGLNEYFASLGKNAPVKSLSELIEFNKKDSLELKYFNQAYLEMAEGKGDLSDMEYKTALANLVRMSQKLGIDRVVEENKLDAIIAPTGSPAWETDLINGDNYYLGSSSPAAWAGYPNITLPMGNIDGLPVGLSIFGKAWSEPTLIQIAFDFEQRSKARIVPSFQVN